MKRKAAEKRVVRAAMRQQELLNMKPVPVDAWAKAERELAKACRALHRARRGEK